MGKKNKPWQRKKSLAEKINNKLSVLRNLVIKDLPDLQPYVIRISNPSKNEVKDFDILGAYTYIGRGDPEEGLSWSGGKFTMNGITISYALYNVNYQQFLYQAMTTPLRLVELFYKCIPEIRNK